MKPLFGFFFFAIISVGLPARAGFMIEPYVGYEMGTMEQTGTPDLDSKGVYYGARLGYDFMGIKIGVDYQTSDQDIDQAGTSGKYAPTDLGAFVGYEFPIFLQVYVSYFAKSEAVFEDSIVPEKFTGSGMRAGIGWTGLPFVAINLEYVTRTYDEYDGVSLDEKLEGTYSALSISFPIP